MEKIFSIKKLLQIWNASGSVLQIQFQAKPNRKTIQRFQRFQKIQKIQKSQKIRAIRLRVFLHLRKTILFISSAYFIAFLLLRFFKPSDANVCNKLFNSIYNIFIEQIIAIRNQNELKLFFQPAPPPIP